MKILKLKLYAEVGTSRKDVLTAGSKGVSQIRGVWEKVVIFNKDIILHWFKFFWLHIEKKYHLKEPKNCHLQFYQTFAKNPHLCMSEKGRGAGRVVWRKYTNVDKGECQNSHVWGRLLWTAQRDGKGEDGIEVKWYRYIY